MAAYAPPVTSHGKYKGKVVEKLLSGYRQLPVAIDIPRLVHVISIETHGVNSIHLTMLLLLSRNSFYTFAEYISILYCRRSHDAATYMIGLHYKILLWLLSYSEYVLSYTYFDLVLILFLMLDPLPILIVILIVILIFILIYSYLFLFILIYSYLFLL